MIEMDLSDETRHLVQNVPGRDAASSGSGQNADRPQGERGAPHPRADGADEAEARADRAVPQSGEHVRVVDGPFSDFTGVVDEVNNERGKVKVMVSIFGRATPVELDFLQVQPV